jgi:hypothetical protein
MECCRLDVEYPTNPNVDTRCPGEAACATLFSARTDESLLAMLVAYHSEIDSPIRLFRHINPNERSRTALLKAAAVPQVTSVRVEQR